MRPAPAGPWSRRPVISALQAVGERLDPGGELDPLILRYAGPGGRREVAHIRPLLRREALEYKLAVELGIPLLLLSGSGPSAAPRPFLWAPCSMSPPAM